MSTVITPKMREAAEDIRCIYTQHTTTSDSISCSTCGHFSLRGRNQDGCTSMNAIPSEVRDDIDIVESSVDVSRSHSPGRATSLPLNIPLPHQRSQAFHARPGYSNETMTTRFAVLYV
ncbi:hypothetical protein AcW2_006978 [Taiwanofungus camphoratus]|nr:hypothetical protein AcW2_006978 [Antrodia cinnamomea]